MIEQNAKNHPDLPLKVDELISILNTSLAQTKLNQADLAIGATYSQSEVQVLADAIKAISDKLDSILIQT